MHGGNGCNNEYRKERGPVRGAEAFKVKYKDVLAANKLTAFIYFTCQGHLFLQAGEEFGRTKFGDSNSFRSHPEVNMLRWHQTVEFSDLVSYYRGMIRLRKRLPGLYDKSADAAERITGERIHGEGLVSFLVDNRGKRDEAGGASSDDLVSEKSGYQQLFIVYNARKTEADVELPPGEWVVLADGTQADCLKNVRSGHNRRVRVEACSGLMLGKL